MTARSPVWNQPPANASSVAASVLQIALHHDVAAEHDLAHRLAVGRHSAASSRDRAPSIAFLERVAHALAAVLLRALADIELGPLRLLRAHGGRAVYLGQSVDVRQSKPIRSMPSIIDAGGAAAATMACTLCVMPCFIFVRRVDQHRVHDRRAAIVRRPCAPESRRRSPCASTLRRQTCVPAIAAIVHGKHQPLQWNIGSVHRYTGWCGIAHTSDVGHGVGVSAAVMVDDALRIAGRARRVVERDRVPFVGRRSPCVIGGSPSAMNAS